MTPANDAWTDRLSDYLDDELDPEERRDIEGHLRDCEGCTRALSELRQVAAMASVLPARTPEPDLWTGIARRLEAGARSGPRFSFTLPQLAAAGLALMVGSAWLALRLVAPEAATPGTRPSPELGLPTAQVDPLDQDPAVIPASFADSQYDAAVIDLEGALRNGRGRLDPATIAVLEENLALIDRAIDEARQALETDPGSAYVSRHLMHTRRAKLDLLRHAAALTTDMN